jgi:eukaryotic-like serine/threonine-protein kinase
LSADDHAERPTSEAAPAHPPAEDPGPRSLPTLTLQTRPTEPAPAPLGLGDASASTGTAPARTLPADVDPARLVRSGRFSFDGGESDDHAPRADPLIGVVVAGRYRIVELLGRGGMGIVYKVEHTSIGKLLAMKLLTGELSRNSEVVRRFKQEALTASKLSSPNTVQVFDYGVSDGLTYLVMELVTGDDLGRVLKLTGALEVGLAGRLLVQIANSLAEAHHHGIVHRDIKPENVMLIRARDGSELAKVLDFGLAKLRESSELNELTSQGAIVGTPYFMSPEQIRGEAVDPRSDIYSLGALAYRALTGHYPFHGPSPMSVFAKHLTEDPVPPHEVAPSVPVAVSEVVMRALAKEPSDRYQRVEDFQAAIVGALSELGESGIDRLLDSGALRRLGTAEARAGVVEPLAIATRDQVEAYERKLRRQRVGGTALGLLVPLALAGGVLNFVVFREQPVVYSGQESEPNDEPGSASRLPFGDRITGHIGKRRSETQSDVDFYAVDVPKGPVTVSLEGLPNMAICLQVFARAEKRPSSQYCPGRPGLALEIPSLALEPGSYVFAVLQDLDPRGAATAPFVHENVSDRYALAVSAATEDEARESEPNDTVQSANELWPEVTRTGTLAWAGDLDVFCPKVEETGPWTLRIEDGPREGGSVLSITRLDARGAGAPVRVHAKKRQRDNATDVSSPWVGLRFETDDAPCFRLEAVVDPHQAGRADPFPLGSRTEYSVRLEPVP